MLHCITFDSKEINDVLLQFLFSIAFFSAAIKKKFSEIILDVSTRDKIWLPQRCELQVADSHTLNGAP